MDIGQAKQLFVDDYIIESHNGTVKKLNQPAKHPGNPVLPMVPQGQPSWEAGMPLCFSSVIFDEDEHVFKMWYSLWEPGKGDEASVLAYATSEDGLEWHKPSLGIFEYRGTRENNILMDREGCACGVLRDPHETDPDMRYKVLFQDASVQIGGAYSADGLHWVRYNDGKPVIPGGHDSQAIAYWDEHLGKYVAIIRDRTGKIKEVRKQLVTDEAARERWRRFWGGPKKDRSPENHSIRRVGQAESEDFVHWGPDRCIVGPDSEDLLNRDQFYNMEVMQYEGLRIGLMTVFSYDPDYCRGAVQLVYSRDGMHWSREDNRATFLSPSDRPGDFDWGSIYPVQCPLVVGDEIWIYYHACNCDHSLDLPDGVAQLWGGIGLAKLRLDGFVSVEAGAEDGMLTTRSFTFEGNRLAINAEATSGYVTVEILDPKGEAIEDFSSDDCDPLTADEIRHTVSWNGGTGLESLEGRSVKLKFHLRGARLFSFRFEDEGNVR